MKKKAFAITGFFIAAILAIVQFLPPEIHKLVYGEAVETAGTEAVVSSAVQAAGSEVAINSTIEAEDSADTTEAIPGNPITVPENEGIEPGCFIRAKVTKVTDGDTLRVEYKGSEYRVRLLDIDTPETVKAGVPVQPYGKKASDELKTMLSGKEVTLAFEKDTDDRYDRLLAFVFLADGTCVNADMVEQGYARVEVVKPNTTYEGYFLRLQEKAIKEKKGLWSLPESERPFVPDRDGNYIPRYYKEAA